MRSPIVGVKTVLFLDPENDATVRFRVEPGAKKVIIFQSAEGTTLYATARLKSVPIRKKLSSLNHQRAPYASSNLSHRVIP